MEHHWNHPPDDILELIFRNLPIGDRTRCKLVCTTWNRLLKPNYIPLPPEPAPWKILPESDSDYEYKPSGLTRKIRFKSLSENRIYSFYIPTFYKQNLCRCCGNSRGWLLMANFWDCEGFSLWNPITGVIHRLPPMILISQSKRVRSVQVFPIDNAVCVVAVICDERMIMMCTTKQAAWTKLDDCLGTDIHYTLTDMLFHSRDATLYVAAQSASVHRELENTFSGVTEVSLMDCCVKVRFLMVGKAVQLVESAITQELKTVLFSYELVYEPAMLFFRHARMQKYKFEVRIAGGGWERVETVDGQEAIFFGSAGSLAVPAVEPVKPGVHSEQDRSWPGSLLSWFMPQL